MAGESIVKPASCLAGPDNMVVHIIDGDREYAGIYG